jgi:hypothetical protein
MRNAIARAGLLIAGIGCDGPRDNPLELPTPADLAQGGVYIAYNHGCTRGCELVAKGDLLQSVDGKAVKTAEEVDAIGLADGNPHALILIDAATKQEKTVEIVATPKVDMPPLVDVPPFWIVAAAELDRAPQWARRRLFAHASPMVQLARIDGGFVDGRQLYGKKRVIVYWGVGDRTEEEEAIAFMRVLQKAQFDLAQKSVDIMFVHVSLASSRRRLMSDTDLRDFADEFALVDGNGQPLPRIPFYRQPNRTEYNEGRELGMENSFQVLGNIGETPSIVLLDERGIVRWHSEGLAEPPDASVPAEQFTIIAAVEFALTRL